MQPTQERTLWDRIIEQQERSSDSGELLQIADTAKVACDAWQLLRNWRLNLKDIGGTLSEDVKAFVCWAQSYERICRSKNWIDSSEKTIALCRLLGAHSELKSLNFLPHQIIVAGFDQLTPLQTHLLEILRSGGIIIEELSASNNKPTASRT